MRREHWTEVRYSEPDVDPNEAIYWWDCVNEDCVQSNRALPAPEYDYLDCQNIPLEDLAEDPELAAEVERKWRAYSKRGKH